MQTGHRNDGSLVEIRISDFLSNVAPGHEPTDEALAVFRAKSFERSTTTKNEWEMYTGFADIRTTKEATPAGKCDRMSSYILPIEAQEAYSLTEGELKTAENVMQEQRTFLARPSWAWASLVIEFKTESGGHPFTFSASEIIFLTADDDRLTRGQIINYAAAVLHNQPRQFCFMIVVSGCRARLLRWDRSGAIVSESFDFVHEDKETMFRFLYKYGSMARHERGYDPTVTAATKQEVQDMKAKITKNRDGLHPVDPVRGTDSHESGRGIIFAKPHKSSGSPIGRGMQGYVAYNVDEKRLVYLKDSWRFADVIPEHKTYIKLWQNEVPYIAKPISDGDVFAGTDAQARPRVQYTLTQDYLRKRGNAKSKSKARIHYRIVFDEAAWQKAEVLHRDLSVSNVMTKDIIPSDGRRRVQGVLNDWDLSKLKKESEKGSSQVHRSYSEQKKHEVSDDLESFIHVTNWLTLKWHWHALTGEPTLLKDYVHRTYDAYNTDQGYNDEIQRMKSQRILRSQPNQPSDRKRKTTVCIKLEDDLPHFPVTSQRRDASPPEGSTITEAVRPPLDDHDSLIQIFQARPECRYRMLRQSGDRPICVAHRGILNSHNEAKILCSTDGEPRPKRSRQSSLNDVKRPARLHTEGPLSILSRKSGSYSLITSRREFHHGRGRRLFQRMSLSEAVVMT
ncbi:predicted protein [Postia placenta Mad-698-R]|nr:predicted protein [Postia placenta Mad-698-R]